MPDISELNGTAIDNVAEFDGLTVSGVAPVPFTGLLDTYTGAAAAYSVRQLKSGVTVAMRVRRETAGGTGDDDEADVAFDTSFTNPTISLDSAISNASTGVTATTLGEFLNVGTVPPYNGGLAFSDPDNLVNTASCFVDEWKDQSGNGNHAEQNVPGSQLQIHSGTVDTDLEQEGGNPALLGNGSTNFSGVNDSSINLNDFGVFSVCRHTDTVTSFRASVGLRGAANATLNYRTSQQSYAGSTYGTVANNTTFNLSSIYADNTSSDAQGFFNQSQIFSTTPVSAAISTLWVANTGGVGSTFWNGTIQEAIFFSSSTKADHTDIETNINTEYLIYQPTDQPTSGLLYDYGSATGGTDAAAAYSVRQLSDKAVICMRIRRDMGAGNPGDDDEINIGFDSNGDLDTQAISDFCGTGTGYITRWWDQSVNGNHADQPVGGTGSNSSQPQIYNGTEVLTQGAKPAVLFNGNGHHFDTTLNNPFSYTGEVSCIAAVHKDTGTYNQFETLISAGATGNSSNNEGKCMAFGYGNSGSSSPRPTFCTDVWKPAGVQYDGTVGTDERQLLAWYISNWSTHRSTGLSNMTLDGSDVTTKNYAGQNPTALNTNALKIGVFDEILTSSYFGGSMQELILYASDQNTNRSGIQSDVNTYFNIY